MSKYQYSGGDRYGVREDWLDQSMAQAILLPTVYGTSLIVESRHANAASSVESTWDSTDTAGAYRQ